MNLIADLHIHGRYSQATSKSLDILNLEKYARQKGVGLLGTGDFTHPKWITELKTHLTEDGSGILTTKTGFPFLLQTEISLIYSQGGRGRRVHNVVLAPDLETVSQITDYLLTKGRIDYDGRPIFKIPCPEFVESLRGINPDIEVIPAHIWTPWFSMFGSKSGFDSVKECFGDQTKHIHALETGLSSDPPMNWRLSQLDKYNLVSFSDLHSFWPWRLGREATIFELGKLDYKSLIGALRTGDGLSGTIEVDPNYGKYHYDGHRDCNVVMSPEESARHKNICPVCKKELTIGVLNRVNELADREEGFRPKNAKPFHSLISLSEIISLVTGKPVAGKKVWEDYNGLVELFGDEFTVLMQTPFEDLLRKTGEKTAQAIIDFREGRVSFAPGYDGTYGIPRLGADQPKKEQRYALPEQKGLGDFF